MKQSRPNSAKNSNYKSQKSRDQSKPLNKQNLKEMILKHQNAFEKGYYCFEDWKLLHSSLFILNEKSITNTVINSWRILKLVNFGDDFVPTGLVFDTLVTLINMEQSIEQAQIVLKSIFFKFIQFNGKYLTDKERQELAFFRVIRSVAEGYRKLLLMSYDDTDNRSEESGDRKDRNEQLYRLHNVFTYKKNLEALKKIEEEFKQCTFEPNINERSEIAQSRYLQPKNIYSSMRSQDRNRIGFSNMIIEEDEEIDQINRTFIANPVPNYPQVSPNGINEHLNRMQKSREIKRINSLKPYKTLNTLNQISEFSINQRESQRKENRLSGYKLLFIIKAEVGKRMYRIKVRENMSVEDVVRNIELMVGFSDEGLLEVVKSYFANYEARIKKVKRQ